jgi:uncharacterized protein (TIGR03067 family)
MASFTLYEKSKKVKNMNRITDMLKLGFVAMLVVASGCSKSHKPDSVTLQGTWKGQDIGAGANGSSSLVLSGANLEFHGANSNEWYKATFTLREDTNPKQLVAVITECPFAQYVGKTANAIYQIQDGTLTITGNEPGNPAVPAAFDAPGARQIVFKLERP